MNGIDAGYLNLAYLVSSVLFIAGLKGLAHPRTAVRGNFLGALGMFLAILATLVMQEILSIELILIGIAAGTVIGAVLAMRIKMTAMPQPTGAFRFSRKPGPAWGRRRSG